MAHAGALQSSIGYHPFRVRAKRGTLPVMPLAVITDETALAHAAAAGDGQAFATLYERYEGRAFNLCLRITNSREDAADALQDAFLNVMRRLPDMKDREVNFGSYLFTAARNACYDLMAKSKRSDPTDEIPETAAHMSGDGGFGFEPDDPEDDPERGRLLEAQQEEIREANGRLPERQREALALCELEEMSYDEIAEVMDMNRNSVAQLISRARINLRGELRGGALATVAPSTEACERALPLIAMQDDRQLDDDSDDAEWLAEHMAGCDTCRLSQEAMQEAGASYRAWTPVAASPFLMEEVMAHAAELTGSDWSKTILERTAARGAAAGASAEGGVAQGFRGPAIGAVIAIIAAVLILFAVFETSLDDPGTVETAEPAAADATVAPKKRAKKAVKKKAKKEAETPAGAAAPDEPVSNDQPSGSSGSGASGTSSPSSPSDPVTKSPAKKRVTKTPTPEPEPDPVVDEPPVVVEPPSRTDDPQPCRPSRTRPTC